LFKFVHGSSSNHVRSEGRSASVAKMYYSGGKPRDDRYVKHNIITIIYTIHLGIRCWPWRINLWTHVLRICNCGLQHGLGYVWHNFFLQISLAFATVQISTRFDFVERGLSGCRSAAVAKIGIIVSRGKNRGGRYRRHYYYYYYIIWYTYMRYVVAAINVASVGGDRKPSGRRVCEASWPPTPPPPPPLEHYCWRIRLQSIRRRGNRLNWAQRGALGTFFRRRLRRTQFVSWFSVFHFPVSCARVESETDFRRSVFRCVIWLTYYNDNIMIIVYYYFFKCWRRVGGFGWRLSRRPSSALILDPGMRRSSSRRKA